MIPVQGYQGQRLAVLGLGRSGLATARALVAGGAEALLWDDSPEARAKAEAAGFACTDLTRHGALEGVACLVTWLDDVGEGIVRSSWTSSIKRWPMEAWCRGGCMIIFLLRAASPSGQ